MRLRKISAQTLAYILLPIGLGLALVGFLVFTQLNSSTRKSLSGTQPTPYVQLGDIEHIPVYPGAEVIEVAEGSILERRLSYRVAADTSMVKAYYESELSSRGWTWLYSTSQLDSHYSWTDPGASLPWHLDLNVTIQPHEERGGTKVSIIYGRYPDADVNLPVYPDASSIEIEHLQEPRSNEDGRGDYPMRITSKSYKAVAEPEDIANFYNSTLTPYGWQFFDMRTLEYATHQTGDITSPNGIFFIGHRKGSKQGTFVKIELTVTASQPQLPDGTTFVVLRVKEDEFDMIPRGHTPRQP
jgi:hypothetical protein